MRRQSLAGICVLAIVVARWRCPGVGRLPAAACRWQKPPARGPGAGHGRAGRGGDRQSGRSRLPDADRRRRGRCAAPRRACGAGAARRRRQHSRRYVRFRALVLLSGFNDPRRATSCRRARRSERSPADGRLRLLRAPSRHRRHAARCSRRSRRKQSEFVRPALTRALAAYGDDRTCGRRWTGLVMRGQDLFRSAVIEALGDYHGAYALAPITEVAKLDGPLQDDAVLALGKLGDKRGARDAGGAAADRAARRAAGDRRGDLPARHQLRVAPEYIVETLQFAIANLGFQELLRVASRPWRRWPSRAARRPLRRSVDAGRPARDPARAPMALALGTVALRNTPLCSSVLEQRADSASRRSAAARRVRHARGGLRGGAVLRDRARGLLAGAGGVAGAQRRRRADRRLEF